MKAIVSLVFILFMAQFTYSQPSLSVREQQEDFIQCRDELYKRNLGLFLFVDEQEYNQYFDSLYHTIQSPKTTIEFLRLINEYLKPVQERHLSVKGFHKKSETEEYFKKNEYGVFPILPNFLNDSTAFIIRNAQRDSSVQLPAKLVSINGKPVSQIRNEIEHYIVQDHNVDTWANWEINNSFGLKYYMYVDTTSTFTFKWKDSLQQVHEAKTESIKKSAYADSIKQQSLAIYDLEQFPHPLQQKFFEDNHIAYLKVPSFSKNKIKYEKETKRLKTTIKSFFKQVEEKDTKHVIIDLRNNLGGSINYVLYLLSYVQENEKPEPLYKSWRKRRFWFGIAEREQKSDRQRKHAFDGDLYILTNGGSYSGSVMFSTFAKLYADASIAGVEAGGRPNGTTAGRFKSLTLKHSKIIVRIPEVRFEYFTPNEEFSIQPDIPVQHRVEDYFDYEEDTQLQFLLQYIKNDQRN